MRLTRAGETLFVRDGRHRITAARVAGHVLIEAEVRDSGEPPPRERRGRRSRTNDFPRSCTTGDAWARSRRSARALRVGVVAPALEAETTSWVQLPPGPLVAGRSGPVIWTPRRFEPAIRIARTRPRRDTPRLRAGACRLSHPYSDRCGFEPRPGPRGTGSSSGRAVCRSARTRLQPRPTIRLRAGVERLSGRAPGLGREVRVRVPPSELNAHKPPAHHDRRLDTTERRSACRT